MRRAAHFGTDETDEIVVVLARIGLRTPRDPAAFSIGERQDGGRAPTVGFGRDQSGRSIVIRGRRAYRNSASTRNRRA